MIFGLTETTEGNSLSRNFPAYMNECIYVCAAGKKGQLCWAQAWLLGRRLVLKSALRRET